MVSPWKIKLGDENGYPFTPARKIQIANPASFQAQKILIHRERDYKDRAKDLLYTHDTIEVFSEHLGELREIFTNDLLPRLHARRTAELMGPRTIFLEMWTTPFVRLCSWPQEENGAGNGWPRLHARV